MEYKVRYNIEETVYVEANSEKEAIAEVEEMINKWWNDVPFNTVNGWSSDIKVI